MAGRIRDEDVALVREKARIDEIVRDYVALKPAGGGSLKGLCPFHDERSPSFHVTPSRGMYYCFGCQEGGDVITFVQKLDHLTFAESVEKLAGRTGVTLRYVEGGAGVNRQQGQRTRLVEANRAAEEYFISRLTSPEAAPARAFLTERGFDAAVADDFRLGFAPKSWDSLTTHLRQKGFTDAELLAGGLVSQGNRGVYDRFRGRLIWPIRDLAGDVVGFGARRLLEDDDGPKYLNTPETPLYKKSQVLYGIDRARKEIAKQQRVVVVEGYTDVMACQIAGVPVAVATCGTAFGGDHIKVLRRLLMDDDQMRGEVIFTFDGDAAGQKAALRAFDEEVCLQGQLLSIAFMAAVEDRYGTEKAVAAGARQLTGVAGVAADRIKRSLGLGGDVTDVATVFDLHPAFRPLAYVDWKVTVDDEVVRLELGDCLARREAGLETWISLLADGHDRALSAIAAAVDPHWHVTPDGTGRWVVQRGDEPADELGEVTLTKFSTGVAFGFDR